MPKQQKRPSQLRSCYAQSGPDPNGYSRRMTKPRLSAGTVILALSFILALALAVGFVLKVATPLLDTWTW